MKLQNLYPGLAVLAVTIGTTLSQLQPWSYRCDEYKRCVKTGLKNAVTDPIGLAECKLTCEEFALFWPKPRGYSGAESRVVDINPDGISASSGASPWLNEAITDQVAWLKAKKSPALPEADPSTTRLSITFSVTDTTSSPLIRKTTDESYTLQVSSDGSDVVNAVVSAPTYFGARHAVETLFQALEFDEVRNKFVALVDWQANDSPEFSHRGVHLDTSRNFMAKEVIMSTIEGMAHSKLNVFHWHITDTHSFPVELLADPINLMTQYGAYNQHSIYTQADIKEVVALANKRGVRVIPELDQPAHIGNGWNFPGAEDYTVCVNAEPWYDYCVEPPCGQLNPGKEEIYDILSKIYIEFFAMFNFDTFHMGADEINFNCWNTSKLVTDFMDSQGLGREERDFIEMWSDFQDLSSQKLKEAAGGDIDIMVWNSHMTWPEYISNLPKEDYIVQIWGEGADTSDPQIKALADQGYRMIFTNVDASYLDCGYGGWIGEGNNWCSPYKGWQAQYSNDLYNLLAIRGVELTVDVKNLVLGGEVALWSEQVDSQTVLGKMFPRAAAYGERLWSNPDTKWYLAEQRMLHHRERLTQRGVMADALQPEWCRQNGGQCYGTEDTPPFVIAPETGAATSITASFVTMLLFAPTLFLALH